MDSELVQYKNEVQDVLIIGGGIAGLATSLALHRLGLKSIVLESSNDIRTSGFAMVLWDNAWRALEVLGIANGVREKFERITGDAFCTSDGHLLASLNFKDAKREVEVRAVHRKVLLQALCEPLPEGTVVFGTRVTSIHKLEGGYTEVVCENGKRINTKVLIGCDGIGSVVGRWLGLKKPQPNGHTVTRGLAKFPYDHKLKPIVLQMVGKGVRMGIIPVGAKIAFWFVVFNPKGRRITEKEHIRDEALMHVRGWADPIIPEVISHTPIESFYRTDIVDRWTWPSFTKPSLYKGGVTVAGDALHPMTPNLGQGGCCALEDAVVLGRNLGRALRMSKQEGLDGRSEMQFIENALKVYTQKRWPRTLAITIRAHILGALLEAESWWLCSIRDIFLPKMMNVDRLTGHTFYDCGALEDECENE